MLTITFLLGLFAMLIGIALVIGAYLNWDWFMNMWGHLDTTKILGRGCARIFYMVGGVVFGIIGLLMMLGLISS